MLSDLNFALLITAPVFFIVALGVWLKRLAWITRVIPPTPRSATEIIPRE